MDKNLIRSWLKEVVTGSKVVAADSNSVTITTHTDTKQSARAISRDKVTLDLFSHILCIKPKLSALLCLLLFLSTALTSGQAQEKRTYHKVKITDLASDNPVRWKFAHTHVEVEGWLTYIAKEDDADWHLRVCDNAKIKDMDKKHCIVVEIIPTLQPSKVFIIPHIGSHLRVRGIARFDAELPGHNWWEVHPAEEVEVIA